MKTPFKTLNETLIVVLALAIPMLAQADTITLTSADGSGTTSMNTVGKWSVDSHGFGPLAPQATNDYFTAGFFVRTPPNGAGITFAGHSLTLGDVRGNPGGQGAPFRSMLYKG